MDSVEILVYQGLSSSFAKCCIQEGREVLPFVARMNRVKTSCIVLVVNNKVAKKEYKAKKGDFIQCRLVPQSTVVFGVVVAVIAVASAVTAGIAMYRAKVANQRAQEEVEKLKKISNNPQIDNRPFLRGASNTSALNNYCPLLLGRQFFTPYLLTGVFYKVEKEDGFEQDTYMVFCCGFSHLQFKNIGFDDVVVKHFSMAEQEAGGKRYQQGTYHFDENNAFAPGGAGPLGQWNTPTNEYMTKTQGAGGETTYTVTFPVLPNAGTSELEKIQTGKEIHETHHLVGTNTKVFWSLYLSEGCTVRWRVVPKNVQFSGSFVSTYIDGVNYNNTKGYYNTPLSYEHNFSKGDHSFACEFNDRGEGATFEVSFEPILQDTGSSFLEISQDGSPLQSLSLLNFKHTSCVCNAELPRTSDIEKGAKDYYSFSLDALAMDVEVAVTFPQGLFFTNPENGYRIGTSVDVTLEYSLDGGATYTKSILFDFNGTKTKKIDKCASNEIRYVAKHTFSFEELSSLKNAGASCVVCRMSSSGSSASGYTNVCYCLYYQSTCYDAQKSQSPLGSASSGGVVACPVVDEALRSKMAILAVKVKSNDTNEEKLKKVNFVAVSLARYFNEITNKWSEDEMPTRNPALLLLHILRSPFHNASRFQDAEIDFESFEDYYYYCDEKQSDLGAFYFDYAVTSPGKKQDLIQKILDATGAVLYKNFEGKIAIAIDAPKTNAVGLFNASNLISCQVKKTFQRTADIYRIKFTNSENDLFKEDTIEINRRDYVGNAPIDRENIIIKELSCPGITESAHVVWFARRLLAIEQLRPVVLTCSVGNEGIFLSPYCKVLIQDDALKNGLFCARIKQVVKEEGGVVTLELDNAVDVSSILGNVQALIQSQKGEVFSLPVVKG